MKIAQLATLCILSIFSIMSTTACAQPYVISTNGAEVTDQKTGLIWRRCIEGMSWNGTACINSTTVCTNTSAVTPATFTHPEALQCAALASSFGTPWRLPNIKELNSIADKTVPSIRIDATIFSNTPLPNFWSASPNARDTTFAWAYRFNNQDLGIFTFGEGALIFNRSASLYVRLVRD